jgi:hypothetical protein
LSTPDEAALLAPLGPARARWDVLRAEVAARFGPVGETWAFSGAKLGWALRIARGKRPLVYLKPLEGTFRASLALGEAVAVPPELAALVAGAPVAAEGRAVRVEVRDDADVATVLALVALRA